MQCARTMVGISSATYVLITLSCPCQTSAGWETTGSYPLAKWYPDQTKTSHQSCIFVCFRCAKSLSHSEATFALCISPLSLLVRLFTRGSLLLLPNVMLLPCIRTPLNRQFDLLGDERGPCVTRGYLRAWSFISLHTISLEAR